MGKNALKTYVGLDLGTTVKFNGGIWKVVGIFDSGGSAFDSEVWCDAMILDQIYNRPVNIYQSVTVRLNSPDAFSGSEGHADFRPADDGFGGSRSRLLREAIRPVDVG